jgi:hypothetical protein
MKNHSLPVETDPLTRNTTHLSNSQKTLFSLVFLCKNSIRIFTLKSKYPGMKKMHAVITALLMVVCFTANSQISGTVFRDFNANGIRNDGTSGTPLEPFLANITVKATLVNGSVFTTTTNASGTYSFSVAQIPAASQVRIEFSGIDSTDANAFQGTGNGTNVQFVTAPSATVNYAASYPGWYSNTMNPWIATARSTVGNASAVGANQSGTFPNLYVRRYNASGDGTATTNTNQNQYTGPVFGEAFQRESRKLFLASYFKRFCGFGPGGIGGIYSTTLTDTALGTTANPSLFVNVSTIGINVGTDVASRGLVSDPTLPSNDVNAFSEVGRRGIGGMSISGDGKYLYFINMFQGKLERLFINNPAVTPTAANVTEWTIPAPSPLPGNTTNFRPMAVKVWKKRIFVGGVCIREISANEAVSDKTGARGIVYELNESTGVFTTVLTFPLTYKKGYTDNNSSWQFRTHYWSPWQNSTTTSVLQNDALSGSNTGTFPYYGQPMLSDIEFDVNGDMVIGIRDRWGDQMGWANYMPVGTTTTYNAIANAEMLRAGNCSGTTWTIENNTSICGSANTPGANLPGLSGYMNTNSVGLGTGTATRGMFYYDSTVIFFNHEFRSMGGLAFLAGSNTISSTIMDPWTSTAGVPSSSYNTNGIAHTYNQTSGSNITGRKRGGFFGGLRLTNDSGNSSTPGKSGGLGDLELLTDPEPIQVGNRIWLDTNGDGIQDPGETTAGVPTGTTVTLRSPGVDGIYGNADDQTWTTTTDAAGNYYFSVLSVSDNRKPAGWAGIGKSILPGYDYRIEITLPAGERVSPANKGSNSFETIDNDAVQSGTLAILNFNTTTTKHDYDIGLNNLASIGDKVWLDNGAGGGISSDGIQNGTEPGVAGITVTLYNNSGTVIGTTVTDAYGIYLFDNLVAGNYTVGFTLPSNYTFTQQNTGSGDGAGTSTDSDPITVTGVNFGRTRTIALAIGQNQRDVDAGIIFKAPPITQSVGDRVWLDNGGGVPANAANGTQDANEPGVSGVTVSLYNGSGVVIATTITDATGYYLFTNVPVGVNYTVGFTLPVAMVFSPNSGLISVATNSDANPVSGKTASFNVNSGDNITYVDAGIYPQSTANASLGDRVWEDVNHDGIQNTNEPGIGGVTVNLYIGAVLTATTTTNAYGYYMFTNLAPGNYIVEFVKPSGYTISPQKVITGTSATDSDPSAVTGKTGSVNLKAGDRNTSIDAGMYKTSPAGTLKLGDKVWNDYNRNGIQDANEPGIPGITARLYQNGPDGLPGTPDDVLIATTFTDAMGNYLFVNLAATSGAPTNYNVQFFNMPVGYGFTPQNAIGSTVANDNNANRIGQTASINLIADDLTIDSGILIGAPPSGKGSLGDKVWYDLNNNGIQDAGELGAGNVTVTLQKDINGDGIFSGVSETNFATTTTNSQGEYLFADLDAGSYKVVFSNMPIGYIVAITNAGTSDDLDSDGDNAGTTISGGTLSTTGVYTLAQGDINLSVDLGLVLPANTNTLGDFVWFDQNNDGLQTVGEPGIEGVMVTLYNNSGTAIAYTTTDVNGLYLFTGLADGTYSVGFTNLPAGFDFATQSAINDLTGSDASIISGRTTTVTLTYASGGTNRDNRSLDAGIISTRAALGDKVWLDTNGDGVQDPGEPGLPGVTVILYASDGTTVITSTITDQNGKYLFSNLNAGSYIVGFSTITSSLEFTQQNTPGDNGNNTNSDADPVTGKSSVIVLSAGEVDLTIDAGIRAKPVATVGDYVWSDINADGIQDPAEPGIGGIVCTLYNSLNQPIGSAITDGKGYYLITNVPPGSGYYVIFSNIPNNPSGVQPSFTVQGLAGGTNTSHADATGKTNTFTVNAGDNITNIDGGIKDYPGRAILALQRFDVSATLRGAIAGIIWVTENEINTSKFIVERSIDNINFSSVGEKAAAGNYAGVSNYLLNDDISSLTGYQVIYYRVKLINADGGFVYSKVVAVRLSSKTSVKIWPNPFVEKITISLVSPSVTTVQARLIDYAGRTISINQYNVVKGNNQLDLNNLTGLANGVYMLQLTDNTGNINQVEKLTKQ